jgi:hypothetical protein
LFLRQEITIRGIILSPQPESICQYHKVKFLATDLRGLPRIEPFCFLIRVDPGKSVAELFFAPWAIPQRPFAVKISGSPEATGADPASPAATSIPFLGLAQTDSRIPAEVRYKSGYINPA